jgi:hypothetical protein
VRVVGDLFITNMNHEADLIFEEYFPPPVRNSPSMLKQAIGQLLTTDRYLHTVMPIEKVCPGFVPDLLFED